MLTFPPDAKDPSLAGFLNHLYIRVSGIPEEFAMLIAT
jgi:hypothetical protein